jgi:hypothetical protein
MRRRNSGRLGAWQAASLTPDILVGLVNAAAIAQVAQRLPEAGFTFRHGHKIRGMISIGSGHERLGLTIDEDNAGDLIATAMADGLKASLRVRDGGDGFAGLVAFFGGLEDRWRGWEGHHSWSSVKGEFEITAHHTGSHVVLRVKLEHRTGVRLSGWATHLDVLLEAGNELANASAQIRELLS